MIDNTQKPKKISWDDFFLNEKNVSKDFMKDIKDTPPQDRKNF